MLELSLPLLRNTGLLAVVAVIYGVAISRLPQRYWNLALGAICALGAILAMLDPTELRPGVLIDSRTTMITLATFFGGPVGGIIAGGFAIAYRLYLGGIGAVAGVSIIAFAFVLGLFGHYLLGVGHRKTKVRDVQLIALVSPVLALGIFVLPADIAWPIFEKTFFPVAVVRILGTTVLGMMILHEQHRVLAEREIRRLAFIDELSGVPNRRSFYKQLDDAWAQWKRYGHQFAVVMIDIDRFKLVNDTYGHPAGDEVIKHLARVMKEEARECDLPARLGGEEFALLLRNTSSDGAFVMAERLRRRIESELIEYDGKVLSYTISAGLSADLDAGAIRRDPMASSDQALYEAKRSGRNRVARGFAEAAGREAEQLLGSAQAGLRNMMGGNMVPGAQQSAEK